MSQSNHVTITDMDEAVREALTGMRSELVQIRETHNQMRDDFRVHVEDDRAVWQIVYAWSGSLRVIVGITAAIFGVLSAWAVKHW